MNRHMKVEAVFDKTWIVSLLGLASSLLLFSLVVISYGVEIDYSSLDFDDPISQEIRAQYESGSGPFMAAPTNVEVHAIEGVGGQLYVCLASAFVGKFVTVKAAGIVASYAYGIENDSICSDCIDSGSCGSEMVFVGADRYSDLLVSDNSIRGDGGVIGTNSFPAELKVYVMNKFLVGIISSKGRR